MDFQRLPLHEIVCISGLWIDEKGIRLFSFSQEQNTEAEMLTKFLSIFDKKQPTLIRVKLITKSVSTTIKTVITIVMSI